MQVRARALIRDLLDGVGDPLVERGFFMLVTLCAHRAVNDDELAVCPDIKPVNLAGPAVSELYRTPAFPVLPLTIQRCERALFTTWKGIKVPGDCGECPPCRARAEIDGVS